jgi:hypothetical protein
MSRDNSCGAWPEKKGGKEPTNPTDKHLERVHDWLRSFARVEPEALTARALDRCTWAAALFLARRSNEETALKSVRIALRDEERWRAKTSPDNSV